MVQVWQIRIKIYMLCDIEAKHIQSYLASFLDKGFAENEELLQLHNENTFKLYVHDLPYSIEEDKIYHKDKIYTVTIRTVNARLAKYFYQECVNTYTKEMKGLTAELRIIPQKRIDTLYTLTTAVLKTDNGYWRKHMSQEMFEERLKVNLIKKWNMFHHEKISEDFQLYTMIEFKNDRPIAMEYKNIKLLGDKICLHIADNETAQDLAHFAIGVGLLEMNSRGAGFVNYRWL